jgi:hypothetical protein
VREPAVWVFTSLRFHAFIGECQVCKRVNLQKQQAAKINFLFYL